MHECLDDTVTPSFDEERVGRMAIWRRASFRIFCLRAHHVP